jgi:Ca2+-transporting ATPase
MGIAGTEVAKEASDIVLLDDNFASIVRAILWGRAIYSGIQKFITFQLSVNISAVLITVITSIESTIQTGRPIGGLTTLQILLLNLVADSLAAMALSTDKPVNALLDKKPHRRTDHIITGNMWRMIIAQSLYQIVIGLLIYYVGPLLYGENTLLRGSILFNTFVYMVLFNELNCRSIDQDFNIFRGITKNKFFLPLFTIGFIVQFPIVTYLGIIFDTVPIPLVWWFISIGLGSGSLIVGVFVRILDKSFNHD